MQTILGANGIIGEELARELASKYGTKIRIVGRNPARINEFDELHKADLLDAEACKSAVEGSAIAYLTVGLPYSSSIFLRDWPIILRNVIAACGEHHCKLVYFDNTYMYDQSEGYQSEESVFKPSGKKGEAKAAAAKLLLEGIESNQVEAVICRAPEFYGPGKTKGVTNTLVFDSIKAGKNPKVFLTSNTKRTLIYTPDAARAMALIAHHDDCYGQTWHLPCDDKRMTYAEIIDFIGAELNQELKVKILGKGILKIASFFNQNLKESQELLPRYVVDNIFDSSKFQNRFPDFEITNYQDGIRSILKEF